MPDVGGSIWDDGEELQRIHKEAKGDFLIVRNDTYYMLEGINLESSKIELVVSDANGIYYVLKAALRHVTFEEEKDG